MYSSTLSSTSALDGGVWSKPRPGRFTPGKDPVPIVLEAGWASRLVWSDAENLVPTGIRSPDRLARRESLYRLSYPDPGKLKNIYKKRLKSTVTSTQKPRTLLQLRRTVTRCT